MARSETEIAVDDMPKVWVKLRYNGYHHLEDDRYRNAGDVIEVEEGRARALIERGHAEPASNASTKKNAKQPRQAAVA
jgi:hypothetical protein